MLKKGKKLFAVLLSLGIVLSGFSQVVLADNTGEINPGENDDIYQSEENLETDVNGGDLLSPDDTTEPDRITPDEDVKEEGESEPPAEEPEITVGDFSKYLTGFEFFKVEGSQETPYTPETPVTAGDTAGIRYAFTIGNAQEEGIKDGATFVLPALPANIECNASERDLKAEDGTVFGSWKIDENRQIIVTFNEKIEERHLEVSGTFQLICTANLTEGEEQEITFDLGTFVGTTLTYVIQKKPEIKKVKPVVVKNGSYDKESGVINWSITLTADKNNPNATLAGYVLTDTFDKAKMQFVEGSLKIDGEDAAEALRQTGKGFVYQFTESFDKGKAEVTYQTKVTDPLNIKSVTNTAKLETADGLHETSANKTLSINEFALGKGANGEIGKNGLEYKDGKYYLHYRIKALYSGNYERVYVIDTLSKLTKEIYESGNGKYTDVKVSYGEKALSKDQLQKAEAVQFTLVDGYKMKVELNPKESVAWIYYTVELTNPKEISFAEFAQYEIKNTAKLFFNDSNKAAASADYSWKFGINSGDPLIALQKAGRFDNSSEENRIRWTVTVNNTVDSDKELKDLSETITLSDKVGNYQEFLEDTLVFEYEDRVTNPAQIETTVSADKKQMTITIKNLGQRKLTITYATKLLLKANGDDQKFSNNLTLKYNGKSQSISREVKIYGGNMLKKEGSYDTTRSSYEGKRYYDWKITANNRLAENKLILRNLIITDTLPAGHNLEEGSLKIGNQVLETKENAETPWYSIKEGKITIHFPETVKKELQITLTTVTEEQMDGRLQEAATNQASMSADGFESPLTVKDTVTVKYTPSLEKKTDYKFGEIVNWEIKINENGNCITKQGATLTDNLPPGLAYKEESAKLFDKDGHEIKGLVVNYEKGDKCLKLTLPDGLDLAKSYKVTFQTDVESYISGITNQIDFDGSATEVTAASEEIYLRESATSGTITGQNIRVRIVKVDASDKEKTLAGAVFALYDSHNNEIQRVTSGENGILVFDKGLSYGKTYTLKEITAPEGYQLSAKEYTLQIGALAAGEKGANVTFDGITNFFSISNVGTLEIYQSVANEPEKKNPTPEPPTPPITPPTPTPVPDPDPTPDPKPLPPDENLEDPEKPGDDDVLRPELPDDEHLEIEETTKNKKKDETKSANENPDLPQTGDNSQLILWMVLLITSLSAAAVIITYRRKVEKK